MSEELIPLPSLIPGRLPAGFCPKSEQERMEAYIRATQVSPSTSRPGTPGEPGKQGQKGQKPIINFGSESEEVEITDGEDSVTFTVPDGVDPDLVIVRPVSLGAQSISSVVNLDRTITVTMTGTVTNPDGEKMVRFCWPVYTVTYQENPVS